MRGMNELMRQAQIMQRKMAQMQEEVGKRTVEASSGGGMVTVTASGDREIKAVRIDPAVVDPKDVEMLQDLVLSAANEALRRAKEMMEQELSSLTGGMNLPGML